MSATTFFGSLLGVFATGVLASVALGRLVIPLLVRRKINDGEQRKASDYLRMLHADKKNTPTMGGVFVVPAALLAMAAGAALLAGFGEASWKGIAALGLCAFVLVSGAGLGMVDDWCKLTGRGKDGLSGRKKLAAQAAIAAAASFGGWWLAGEQGGVIELPFLTLQAGWWTIPLGVFVIVGASNAFNLTDGLDGLAGGTGSVAFYALGGAVGVLAWFAQGNADLAAVAAAALASSGALLGFLWWNRYPARVFMGDTGSLGFGALLGVLAVLGRVEVLLAVAGGVFVAEAASVMLQVGYFKATGGKRIFRCAPLHHHFQFQGMHETLVTRRFIRAGSICALASLLLVPTLGRVRPALQPASAISARAAERAAVPADAQVEGAAKRQVPTQSAE